MLAGMGEPTGQAAPARSPASRQGRRYRGQPREVRRAEQRERILHAARDVFAARGYGSASIDDIVTAARVSRTTFYEFFANKEQCLLAVHELGLQRIGAAVLDVVAQAAEDGLEPTERIRAEVRAVMAAYAADPAMARVMLIEVVAATPAAAQARARARRAAARVIEEQLAAYPYWGRRSDTERRTASVAAMAAIAEPLADLVAAGAPERWEELVEPVSAFVASGLIPAHS